jgi:hypothetical protein
MTEQEWLQGADPQKMLAFLPEGEWEPWPFSCACFLTECRRGGGLCPAYRKLRLFSCACCRQVQHLLGDPLCQAALSAAEEYADGTLDQDSYGRASTEFDTKRRSRFPHYEEDEGEAWNALYCAVHRRWETYLDEHFAHKRWELAAAVARDMIAATGPDLAGILANLLRDILGNPFLPLTIDPAWLTPTVLCLAQTAYEERLLPAGDLNPIRLAILADALEETGCTRSEILDHLHSPGPHPRGCWALDLLLRPGLARPQQRTR